MIFDEGYMAQMNFWCANLWRRACDRFIAAQHMAILAVHVGIAAMWTNRPDPERKCLINGDGANAI
jgi:hypothetical protein